MIVMIFCLNQDSQDYRIFRIFFVPVVGVLTDHYFEEREANLFLLGGSRGLGLFHAKPQSK
jgi:hypothetical protein